MNLKGLGFFYQWIIAESKLGRSYQEIISNSKLGSSSEILQNQNIPKLSFLFHLDLRKSRGHGLTNG